MVGRHIQEQCDAGNGLLESGGPLRHLCSNQCRCPFFVQEAQGCRSVLELTSGTGRLSVPLIRSQIPLSCLDNSPEMLAGLRRKLQSQGLSAPIYEMDAENFSLPQKFDLIIVPFNAFAEFTDPAKALATIHTWRIGGD